MGEKRKHFRNPAMLALQDKLDGIVKTYTLPEFVVETKHKPKNVVTNTIAEGYKWLNDHPYLQLAYDGINTGLYVASAFPALAPVTLPIAIGMSAVQGGAAAADAYETGFNENNVLDMASAVPGLTITEHAIKTGTKKALASQGKSTKYAKHYTKYMPKTVGVRKYPTWFLAAMKDSRYAPAATLIYGEGLLNDGLNVKLIYEDVSDIVESKKSGGKLIPKYLTPWSTLKRMPQVLNEEGQKLWHLDNDKNNILYILTHPQNDEQYLLFLPKLDDLYNNGLISKEEWNQAEDNLEVNFRLSAGIKTGHSTSSYFDKKRTLQLVEDYKNNADLAMEALNWGSMALPAAGWVSDLASRIAGNIASRNKFYFRYMPPLGYDSPIQRFKTVVGHIIKDEPLGEDVTRAWGDLKGLGEYISANSNEMADKLATRFRELAYRKYLGLELTEPLYLDNPDGTVRYNLPYIELEFKKAGLKINPRDVDTNVVQDYLTSNGGNVNSKLLDIVSLGNRSFKVLELSDIWDLHPFLRTGDGITTRFITPITLSFNGSKNKWLHNLSERIGINNKEAKQWLAANSEDSDLFDPAWFSYGGIRGKAFNWINDVLIPKTDLNPNNWKLLNTIDKKAANFEVGNILGGKPFKMRTRVPITKVMESLNKADKMVSKIIERDFDDPVIHTYYGHLSNDILPKEVWMYRSTGLTPEESLFNLNSYFLKNLKQGGKLIKKKN